MSHAKSLEHDWAGVAALLVWQKVPKEGIRFTRAEMATLPVDRVLFFETDEPLIHFRWISPEDAEVEAVRVSLKTAGREKLGVSELQGRWQKTAVMLLWLLARDGITLSAQDRDQLPADQVMLTTAHGDTVEFRYVPRAEAERIRAFELEHEGKIVTEALQ